MFVVVLGHSVALSLDEQTQDDEPMMSVVIAQPVNQAAVMYYTCLLNCSLLCFLSPKNKQITFPKAREAEAKKHGLALEQLLRYGK